MRRTRTTTLLLAAVSIGSYLAPSGGSTRADTIVLPGVGEGTLTPDTLAVFTTSVKMIEPPAGLPQKWFSAEAEFVGTVSAATLTSVVTVEAMTDAEHQGRRLRITGSSAAAGQIRSIATNGSNQIDITEAFAVLPEAGDSIEIFTGELPPGRWDGACTQADPCLDYRQVFLFGIGGPVWLWFDSGDVWDSDDEWCDETHGPPGRCPVPPQVIQNRFLADEFHDPAAENQIRWGLSGTDLTGETFAVIDCDSNSNYPVYAGGLFENQNGSASPAAADGPTPWMVVQGIETRCWNRPAPGTATSQNAWGQGTGIYRREFSGNLLAIHNRHGDLWDGASLVSGNGGNFTQGDRYQGGVVLVDIEADLADYTQMAGRCSATNTPYRSCQGTEFTGRARGQNGEDIRPTFVNAVGGGNVLWVGGGIPNHNKGGGIATGLPRYFVDALGFHDYFGNSGVGGRQHVTLVNAQFQGAPGEAAPADVVRVAPRPDRWGTDYRVLILNSRFSDMPDGSAVVRFVPGTTVDRGTDTSLDMDWANVSVMHYGSIVTKHHSVVRGSEIDGGIDWTGRCLFFDAANPTVNVSRIIELYSGTESLDTRCKRHFVDLEGWVDGDDVPNQFSLCSEDFVSYPSEAMTGTMQQPGNAGYVNGWQFFSQGNSGDWGGEGVEIDVTAELETSPELQNAVLDACSHAQTYPLGQTLPAGFVSTPDNPISSIVVAGTRDLGFDAHDDLPPACVSPCEELSITTMALEADQTPVIHYQDPNPAADVTGYNVYRASAPAGPWILLASDVPDLDANTPGLQYVDPTGAVGGPWFYRVAALNGMCGAEGPW